MLLSSLLLLPLAVASSVTVYVQSVSSEPNSSPLAAPIPIAHIDYDTTTLDASISSYTPPKGSYTPDHLLRIGLRDSTSGQWRGVVTSAAGFTEEYKKKFLVHVDEKGEPFHIGFSTSAKGSGDEVEVQVLQKATGPNPVLNKPIVLNADGKVDDKEPEKTFFQKYWWVLALFLVIQVVAGGGDK